MAQIHILMAGIMVPGLLFAAPAIASEGSTSVVAPVDAPQEDVAAPDRPAPDTPFAGSTVVDDSTLAAAKGMADVNVIEQAANVRNTSTVSGNVINGDPTTGTISIDGASFGNFSGLAMVNANTGNNVSINSAMNVNVAIQ